ncbi:hypothetical protein [Acetobacter pasteurianus]|uniref:Tail fiber protein n=1 Tax=Acetobacter pasteurianus subsp. pasteurianus TaxID=481145 RepID=A0A1Y0YB09_ACEPA|nr:hypothetical protein [Acetobacter pasteurianus]ARW48165.1 hypothetical protein S1001342_01842 [Acetobacter pasteurianus subsp. pasteurianus]
MKYSELPSVITSLFASGASSSAVTDIPDTQASSGDGRVSWKLGYPPETMIARSAGGVPPYGQDANGIGKKLSQYIQALQAGNIPKWTQDFANAIGGYPSGALAADPSTVGVFWVSTADDNTTQPGANGASWQSLFTGYVKKSGDTMSGILNNSSWVAGGVGGGWNNNNPANGEYVFTKGIEFGNPANNGYFRGTWCVTDVHGNGAADRSGLNLTGYDSTGVTYQWYFAWNGRVTTPGGVLAFESDLSGYVANTNPGIPGAQAGTSLCVNPSDGRANFAYSGNTKIGALAWYSDVQTETQARVNAVTSEANAREAADTTLQNNINAKLDSSFVASGLFDGSQGSTTSGTIVGGTWMRVGNTLTQSLVIENIGSGTVTFPFAFSGNNNQVVVIVQDGTGSNNTFSTGAITTSGTGIHSSGGGGTGRLHLTVSGPYGT